MYAKSDQQCRCWRIISNLICKSLSYNFHLSNTQGYPYPRPCSSFLYLSGSAHLFDDKAWKGVQHLGNLEITTPDGEQERHDLHPVRAALILHVNQLCE